MKRFRERNDRKVSGCICFFLLFELSNLHFDFRTIVAQEVIATSLATSSEDVTNIDISHDVAPLSQSAKFDNSKLWYVKIQEHRDEKLIHEFNNPEPNTQSIERKSSSNMFDILQCNTSSISRSSMIVQFYTSNVNDCGNTCIDLVEHFLQLAMHLSDIAKTSKDSNKPPLFFAINCEIHTSLCQQQQITYYPAIRLYKHGGDGQYTSKDIIEISYQHLHPYEIIRILEFSADDLSEKDEEFHVTVNMTKPQIEQTLLSSTDNESTSTVTFYRHRSRRDLLNDIHIALDYTLRAVIFEKRRNVHLIHLPHHNKRHSPLTVTEQEVLKSFLLLIRKTFRQSPVDTSNVDRMIKAVIDGFTYAIKNHDYMNSFLDEHRPISAQFSEHACPNDVLADGEKILMNEETETIQSNRRYHESYTCIMWDLLLMISVGMVDYNLQSYDGTEMIHPASALTTIKEYIDVFGLSSKVISSDTENNDDGRIVADDIARTQFLKLYNDCSFMNRCLSLPDAPKMVYDDNKHQISKEYVVKVTTTISEWKFVPLYIAAVRNSVMNTGNNIGQRWPTNDICSICWDDNIGESNTNQHHGLNLYKFLKVEYGQMDAVTATYRHELVHESSLLKPRSTKPMIVDGNLAESDETVVDHESRRQSVFSEEEEEEAPFASRPNALTLLNHRPLYLLILFAVFMRWLYTQYEQHRKNLISLWFSQKSIDTVGSVEPSKFYSISSDANCELDGSVRSHRTIEYNCGKDENEMKFSPRYVSPRVHRLMKRRVASEQEQQKEHLQKASLMSLQLQNLEEPVNLDDELKFNDDSGMDASYRSNNSFGQERGRSSSISNSTSNGMVNVPITPPLSYDKYSNSSNLTSHYHHQLRQRKSPVVPFTSKADDDTCLK